MKINIKLLLGLFLVINFSFAQQLTITETVDYINEKLKNEQEDIILKNDGTFFYTKYIADFFYDHLSIEEMNKKFASKNYKLVKKWYYEANIRDLYLEKYILGDNFWIKLKCKQSYCAIERDYSFKKSGYPKNEDYIPMIFNRREKRDKVFNAFQYLLELLESSNEYKIIDDDTFAKENFKHTLSSITSLKSKDEIKLTRNSGVFFIDIEISGITKVFVIDSGASEISISSEIEIELINKGVIKKEDYLMPALYRIADGSIVSKRRVLLKQIKVGDFVINNVSASIGSSNTPLLLGKSFLDKFSRWTIDNNTEKLILEK